MKILLFGDAHFCERSSIITKFGAKYSVRLENQLQTFKWVKEQALANNCEMVIGLGDFFNTSQLSDMEITAARDLEFADLPTYFIVGNHESSSQSLTYNSTKILEAKNHHIIAEPYTISLENLDICLLPYIIETDRKQMLEYFPKNNKKRVILSHNDIKGISYGPVISATGFELSDIESACDLYINAHIHNGQQITNKIYNIGNLTGQNFSEDAFKYPHGIFILDSDTLQITFIENPYAFNFYKIQIDNEADLNILSNLKTNAIVSLKCNNKLINATKNRLEELSDKILESRIISIKNYEESSENTTIDLSVDHLARFIECCKASIENSKLLDEELAEVCK